MRLGQINLSFYQVKGAVVREVLERLGHPVVVTEGSHGDMFPKLAAGEIDLLVAAWLPGAHGTYWDEYGDQAVQLAPLYDDARLFWAVPSYVPEDAVSTIADLKKPDVTERMAAEVLAVGPGSGLERGSEAMMDAYGLAEAGYSLATGSPAEWTGVLGAAVPEERWVVVPMWRPLFLNEAYDVRPLEEPLGLLGGTDTAYLVARTGLENELPEETMAVLQRLELSTDAVTLMDYLVNVDSLSVRAAAQQWVEAHPETVETWFGEAE